MKILALIPARGGSKRLPRKNIKKLADRPLIEWSIDSALSCKKISKVVVSSDDSEVIGLAKKMGAEAPFIRPEKLSLDNSTSFDVAKHAIEYYASQGEFFDFLLLLQPTSPLRQLSHIEESLALLVEKDADAIISVCKESHSPLWSNTINDDRSLKGFIREQVKNKRSQDLPQYYRLNGAIYLVKIDKALEEKTLFISDNIYAYEMDELSSVDIDTELDFLLAELLMKQ
ncbi:MAG: cytidylyltransferase domain-containing protein [Cellvibrionaceae bacterium]